MKEKLGFLESLPCSSCSLLQYSFIFIPSPITNTSRTSCINATILDTIFLASVTNYYLDQNFVNTRHRSVPYAKEKNCLKLLQFYIYFTFRLIPIHNIYWIISPLYLEEYICMFLQPTAALT